MLDTELDARLKRHEDKIDALLRIPEPKEAPGLTVTAAAARLGSARREPKHGASLDNRRMLYKQRNRIPEAVLKAFIEKQQKGNPSIPTSPPVIPRKIDSLALDERMTQMDEKLDVLLRLTIPKPQPHMTRKEVSERLKVSLNTVARWIRHPSHAAGGRPARECH